MARRVGGRHFVLTCFLQTFVAIAEFTVYNETGTGMTRVDMFMPPKNYATQQDLLDTGFQPGRYALNITLDTSGSAGSNDDPIPFEKGKYTIETQICNGQVCLHAEERLLHVLAQLTSGHVGLGSVTATIHTRACSRQPTPPLS